MNKDIFLALSERLTGINSLKWINEDNGQLSSSSRPGLCFPCALIDISFSGCENMTKYVQKVSVNITIRVGVNDLSGVTSKAPQQVRNKSLERLNMLDDIHSALQGWDNNRMFWPLKRISAVPEKMNDGIKVYKLTYQTVYIVQSNPG